MPNLIERDGVFEVRNMAHQLHVASEAGAQIPSWVKIKEPS